MGEKLHFRWSLDQCLAKRDKMLRFSGGLEFGIGLGLWYDSGYWLGLGFGWGLGPGLDLKSRHRGCKSDVT